MLNRLWVETRHGDVRVLHGIKNDRNDQISYNVEFVPNKNSMDSQSSSVMGKTILKSVAPNNPTLISFEFNLKRGLYDVYLTKVKRIEGSEIDLDEESRFMYDEPIMVGKPYSIQLKKENTYSYGQSGVRIRIRSTEIPLDSDTVYYKINREGISDIKYYIPFNNGDKIDFFIKGVSEDEVEIFLGNSSFQLETNV